jgi:HPt (histidine-containing phosphotransfer) domain-containing protein
MTVMSTILQQLKDTGADVDGALARFGGNAALYEKFLKKFPGDDSFARIEPAIAAGDHKEMFEAVHSLKGVSGNLGLTGLYQAACSMTELLRAGKDEEAVQSYEAVKKEYDKAAEIITRAE